MIRAELLNNLLNMDKSVGDLTDELNKLEWDSSEELVALNRQHLVNVLNKYRMGKINESDIEEWANAVEVREDIGREKEHEKLINEVLYELANPYLTKQLTLERAAMLDLMLT